MCTSGLDSCNIFLGFFFLTKGRLSVGQGGGLFLGGVLCGGRGMVVDQLGGSKD